MNEETTRKSLSEMTIEELWILFPIILKEHNPQYKDWYQEEKESILSYLKSEDVYRINHIGSTAVNDLVAKPIVDILLELNRSCDIQRLMNELVNQGWTLMSKKIDTEIDISYNKGYTIHGFTEKVYHLHVRYLSDWNELYFRDYLIEHKGIANEYGELKLSLLEEFKNNRDGYTNAKTDFIHKYTNFAKDLYKSRYLPSNKVELSYDTVAKDYAKALYYELDQKPFDRYILKAFCGRIRPKGNVCDLGCGPGHITRFIKDKGIDVFGADISDGMVHVAKTLNPDISFVKENMLELSLEDNSLAGIILFYSIVNLSIEEVAIAFNEAKRVLEEDGMLIIAFHLGDGVLQLSDWFDKKVDVQFTYFDIDRIKEMIESIGFDILECIIRYPYKGYEYESKRGYIMCQKSVTTK
jgi:GrpB-like predicted nucleotidyltransferase (UPF0157 family)/ubiquinone/menaquinone biosynthesis C-methylase UbiE